MSSSAGSMERRKTCRWNSFAFLRNAASLPPKRAIFLQPTNNGPSSPGLWRSLRRFGDRVIVGPLIPAQAGIQRRKLGPRIRGDERMGGTMSQRTKPPFRADHVGSLLRPAALKKAREQRAKDEITPAQLKEIEDREIERVIRKQEEVGLQAITDGEFRRSWWHLDFLWGLDGIEKHVMDTGIAFTGVTTRNKGLKVTGKIAFSGHPM